MLWTKVASALDGLNPDQIRMMLWEREWVAVIRHHVLKHYPGPALSPGSNREPTFGQ